MNSIKSCLKSFLPGKDIAKFLTILDLNFSFELRSGLGEI